MLCQTDVVKKQLVSLINWHEPLLKTGLDVSYILMIGSHLNANKNTLWMLKEFITCYFM